MIEQILVSIIVVLMIIMAIRWTKPLYEYFMDSNEELPQVSQYINFNFTEKPMMDYKENYICQWWKEGGDANKYCDCDQYRCQNAKYNQSNAMAGTGQDLEKTNIRIHQLDPLHQLAYYENTERYCANHPQDIRCPDYWHYKNPSC